MKQLQEKVLEHALSVINTLQKEGFESYLVGGCVRDLLREKSPKDWDVTTNANPNEILALFPDSFYENDYGTVGVIWRENKAEEHVSHETPSSPVVAVGDTERVSEVIEVTPYRTEAKYSNKRHPDSVQFTKKLESDLARRDFTMNAIAYDPVKDELVDPYKGQKDIKDKIIRTVGEAKDRFNEDALRMMRAIRLSTELDFAISTETQEGIIHNAESLKEISSERVRDEFIRLLMSENPMGGIVMMYQLGILQYVLPELGEGVKCEQNGDHIYDVWEHNLRAMNHAAERHWPLHIRIGALLHDVSKPETRRWSDEKKDWTFYGHDVVGGRVAKKILERLKFPKQTIDTVSKLVRYHMFFTDIDKITLSAVRRLVSGVGKENVWDLMKIRACDRIGMGRPKEKPYRLRKYESMVEEAMRAPVTVAMLKVDGAKIMEITGEKPGYRIGLLLHALLEEVLDDPTRNVEEYLEKRTKEFANLPEADLKKIGEAGKEKREAEEGREIQEIRDRYHVK